MNTIRLPKFDDMHAHLRDGKSLKRTVEDLSAWSARAIIMPNLTPAIDNIEALKNYRARIEKALPENSNFTPLMTLYLSENINKNIIKQAKDTQIHAIKWYPKGATTNSAQGIANHKNIAPLLEEMEKQQLHLLIHGEAINPEYDIFERESRFIENILSPIKKEHPALKIVMEHITTADAVDYILSQDKNLAATITPQHLLFNRNQLLVGGIKPHYYCLPILKTENDRKRLLEAATSGDPRFFLGTDSAPHPRQQKESACGCAGCYSAWHAPALYAQAFDSIGKIDKLKDFACTFGADYYGLKHNTKEEILLTKAPMEIPEQLNYYEEEQLTPLEAGKTLTWRWEKL